MSTSSNVGPPTRDRDRDRLSDHDKSIIGQARQLAGVQSGPAVVRAYFGTAAVSYRDTAHAYAEAFSQATGVIGELLAIIDRLADGGAAVIMDSESDEPLARSQPESGGQAEVIRASSANAPADIMLVRPRTYEITFTGRAGHVLRAAFDDCTVTIGPGTQPCARNCRTRQPCGDLCSGSSASGLKWWTCTSWCPGSGEAIHLAIGASLPRGSQRT